MEYTLANQRLAAGASSWRPGVTHMLLLSYFALFGLILGTTGVLWDDIQKALRLSSGAYGTASLVTPLTGAGVLLAVGPLTRWASKKRIVVASLVAIAVAQFGLAIVDGFWAFVAVRALTGVGYGLLEGVITSATIDWEQATGRKAMNLMHAAFSGGAVLGALAAGALVSGPWEYTQVLLALSLLSLLPCVLTVPVQFPPFVRSQEASGGSLRTTVASITGRPGLMVFVVLSLVAACAEALTGFWSVIYLRGLGASLLVSGTVLALFNGAMFVGRLANAMVVARAGIGASLVLSGCGVLVATTLLVLPNAVTAAGAFIVLGLAIAGVVPTMLSAAANLAPGHTTAISTVILEAAFIGFVVAPPAIGWGADLLSLRAALPLVLGATGLAMLGLVRAIPAELRGDPHG